MTELSLPLKDPKLLRKIQNHTAKALTKPQRLTPEEEAQFQALEAFQPEPAEIKDAAAAFEAYLIFLESQKL
jgi:hypothetical protein